MKLSFYKCWSIGLLLLFGTGLANAQFITTWRTTDGSITIPAGGATYSYNITWTNQNNAGVGDGSATGQTGAFTINSLEPDSDYRVSITGTFPTLSFAFYNVGNSNQEIREINQWGTNVWTSLSTSFSGCLNLIETATDAPVLTGVNSLSQMFLNCTSFNGDLNNWTVTSIQNMSSMFFGCTNFNGNITSWNVTGVTDISQMFLGTSFNQDISGWNVSNVEFMSGTFRNCPFNQDISGWNTSSVQSMRQMFAGNTSFNQPLNTNAGNWNVSNVTNMERMFNGATAFNQDLNNWDVSEVLTMADMFSGATAFNGNISSWTPIKVINMSSMFADFSGGTMSFNSNISGWNVGSVTNMAAMFYESDAFNQDLSGWNISLVTSMSDMFRNTAMSTTNYDATLIGWEAQTLQTNVSLGATGVTYCTSETARASLTNAGTNNWTIDDAGIDPACPTIWNGATWSGGAPTDSRNAVLAGAFTVGSGNDGDITCKDLTINSGITLTMATGSVTVAGNFDNNGNAFTQTGGTFTFNGSSAQSVEGTNSFGDLVINNASGVTLNSATDVTGILRLTSGTLASGGNLTLKSTGTSAGTTATVDFSGAGTVSGNVTVERFLDGGTQAGYRYIATNVTGQTLANVNDDVALAGLGTTFSPGSGTGYTWNTTSPYPNHFIYNQALVSGGTAGAGSLNGQSLNNAQFGWETATSATALNPGSGMILRIGGSNATIGFTGTLQTGNVALSLANGGQTNSGWHLLGNPYAATLDWNLLYDDASTTGMEPIAYVFDANATYTGTYAGYNAMTDMSVNGGTENIASGQGFFVQASSGGGSLTLKTSHTLSADTEFFRTKQNAPEIQGELRMKLADAQGNEDELLIYFAEGMTEGKDLGDAKKFFEHADGFPKLASHAYGQDLMMDCRQPVGQETQTFNLSIIAGKVGAYTLKASTIAKFAVGTEIFLEDKQENMLIDLNQVSEYTFDLAKGELVENRFNIILKNNQVTSIEDDLAERGVSIHSSGNRLFMSFADFQSAEAQIAVYDLQGRQLLAQSTEGQTQISFEMPKSGIYIVKVENAKGLVTRKLYVE